MANIILPVRLGTGTLDGTKFLKDNGAWSSINYTTDIINKPTTTEVSEGTNLYYTNTRVQTFGDTRYLRLSGGTLTGNLILNSDPTNALQAATKQYVDSLSTGLKVKTSVAAASTSNITIANPGFTTLDGVTLVSGTSRILVKDQTNPAENGIYIFNGAASALTRSTDLDDWSEVPAAYVFVDNGTTNGQTGWTVSGVPGVGTIGTTDMPWSLFSRAQQYTSGVGLSLTGNAFNISNTGVSAATYGSTTQVPVIAVNARGQITTASNSTIAFPVTSVNSKTGAVVLTTTDITEGTNLYFTNARVQSAISGTTPISVVSGVISHSNSGVTASTYRSVTVNATGHITAGTNPTTLAGYGITDAIQNQFTSAQTGSYWINGVGRMGILNTNAALTSAHQVFLNPGGNSTRWAWFLNTAESTGNVGSNLVLNRYDDTGTLIGTSMSITRSTSVVNFGVNPTSAGNQILNTANHVEGDAFSPILTGANVLSTFVSNSSGHVTTLTTRVLTATDINAAPINGSGSYVQVQNTSAQSGDAWMAGYLRSTTQIMAPLFSSGSSSGITSIIAGSTASRGAEIALRGAAYSTTPGEISFHTGVGGVTTQPETMRLRSDGVLTVPNNIWIGTAGGVSNPLSVNKSVIVGASTAFIQNSNNTAGTFGLVVNTANTDATTVPFTVRSNGDDKFKVLGNGNVGIAHLAPTARLDIGVSGAVELGFTGTGTANILHQTSAQPLYINTTTGQINLGTSGSGSQHLTIINGGNVGIANVAPSEKLEVTGNIKASGSVASTNFTSSIADDVNITAPIGHASRFFVGTSEIVTISQDGILSVGNPTPSTVRASPLQVQGNIWCTDAYILGTTNTPIAEFGLSGSTSAFIRTMGTGDITFQTSATTVRARVNGTTGNFEVNNQIKISGGSPAANKILTSDGSGLGTWNTVDTVLPNIGTAGTYRSVTTDSKGRVTAGTNPTTLAGYGVTEVDVAGKIKGSALFLTGKVITANYTILATDYTLIVNTPDDPVTINLPSAATNAGRILVFKLLTTTGGYTVVPTSGQTIDGAATMSGGLDKASIAIQAINNNWYIIYQYKP